MNRKYEEFRAKWKLDHSPKDGNHRDGNQDELLAAARVKALSENLAGLAFSGGGIRSRDFRDRSPARAGQPETPAILRRPLNRLGRGLCRRLARDVDPTRGGPAQRRAPARLSRIRQGEAVRFSGYRIGIQVAEIVDEVLRPLFDQLAIDFAGAAAPGSNLLLREIRERIGAEVLRPGRADGAVPQPDHRAWCMRKSKAPIS